MYVPVQIAHENTRGIRQTGTRTYISRQPGELATTPVYHPILVFLCFAEQRLNSLSDIQYMCHWRIHFVSTFCVYVLLQEGGEGGDAVCLCTRRLCHVHDSPRAQSYKIKLSF